ncbi:Rap1a/Tai family immunity protein [Falsiroseomonas oryzae]|uniref:Rap1a/Tai family immunity protein n=1 Tax=Falsiroseomonas oryzae TaxID=2766473 RepID=UPI0022EB1F5D|nr:Rap1a/Tai family immunity protein [Roseomonas sp. MO-31]
MRRATWLPATIFAMGLGIGPALAQGSTPSTAEPVSTATLASICAATSPNAESPLTAYCRGFMVGVGQYHNAVSAARGRRIFCLPDPSPTIEQVQSAFVRWAAANTQYGQDRAVDGLMRFAATTYPCPPEPAPANTRARQR